MTKTATKTCYMVQAFAGRDRVYFNGEAMACVTLTRGRADTFDDEAEAQAAAERWKSEQPNWSLGEIREVEIVAEEARAEEAHAAATPTARPARADRGSCPGTWSIRPPATRLRPP